MARTKGIKERDILKEHYNRTEPITWGYIRVSSSDQNLDRQEQALLEYGVQPDFVIQDKASGKDFNRTGYLTLKKSLKAGDTLVIKELDRLGRDAEGIKEEWQSLKGQGIDIVVIDQPILNTVGKDDLTKNLISNIVFELLTYMAESERIKIKKRQQEGLAQAKARGVKIGRPKKQDEVNKAVEMYLNNTSTVAEILTLCGVSRATFYKELKERGIK